MLLSIPGRKEKKVQLAYLSFVDFNSFTTMPLALFNYVFIIFWTCAVHDDFIHATLILDAGCISHCFSTFSLAFALSVVHNGSESFLFSSSNLFTQLTTLHTTYLAYFYMSKQLEKSKTRNF